jgi:hypothetical protein
MQYISRQFFQLIPVILVLAASSPTPSVAQATPNCTQDVATWDFFADSSVKASEQQMFKDFFCQMIPSLKGWAKGIGWDVPFELPRPYILVGEHYDGGPSRSLTPAWEGNRGRMEFPAARVKPDPRDGKMKAAVAHELTHFYFPNGNRMLAEGFAIYAQDETRSLGGNDAYPNFETPVHWWVKCQSKLGPLRPMIDLKTLDDTVTPLSLNDNLPTLTFSEQQLASYLIAGSFVRFLIERYGMNLFHNLYDKTRFVPGRHVVRTKDNWTEVYQKPLASLQIEWNTMLDALPSCAGIVLRLE